jgi:acetyl-CoA carboxylase carboxyltransferase component
VAQLEKDEQRKIEEMANRFNVPQDYVRSSLSIRQASSVLDKLEAFNEERKMIEQGDPEAVIRQHGLGRRTARERVSKLLDRGSFEELDLWHRPYETGFDIGEGTGKGDGVVVGYGSMNERPITVWAQDATVMGGTVGTVHARKVTMIMENALNARTPIIGIFDSEGVRAQDAIQYPDFYSPSSMAYFQTLSSGVIPKISLVMGQCVGEMAIIAGLGDFLFMVRDTSFMHLMPPSPGVTGQSLGDPRNVHAKVGSCDVIAENEEDCLLKCRNLLSYLPSHNMEMPPVVDTGDDPSRREEELLELVPVNSRKVFDMHKLISLVVDNGELFEIKSHFARNLITGFARLDGQSVGIVASNTMFMGGCMTLDAADKMSRFVRFCDAFNIPLIWLADTPAFLPAVDEETRGLIRHGSRMIMANSEATVPRITVTTRKHFGGGRLAMPGPGLASDIAVAWPNHEPGLMGAEGAVSIIYRKQLGSIPDEEQRAELAKKHVEEMQWILDMQVREATQKIIDPRDTRPFLVKSLRWLRERRQDLPEKKHENIRM